MDILIWIIVIIVVYIGGAILIGKMLKVGQCGKPAPAPEKKYSDLFDISTCKKCGKKYWSVYKKGNNVCIACQIINLKEPNNALDSHSRTGSPCFTDGNQTTSGKDLLPGNRHNGKEAVQHGVNAPAALYRKTQTSISGKVGKPRNKGKVKRCNAVKNEATNKVKH